MSDSKNLTYRERRELKAERLREWADKRESKADAAYAATKQLSDMIPFGQPILVGHHSEGRHRRDIARIDNGMRATVDNSRKAQEFNERADNIERQAANAIYSDDADAIERLTDKIAKLEAQREHVKAANAAYRKEHKAELKGLSAYQRDQALPYRSYVGTNLSGNISRLRKRLDGLKNQAAVIESGSRGVGRQMLARYGGDCAECGSTVAKGDSMTYYRLTREVVCSTCA